MLERRLQESSSCRIFSKGLEMLGEEYEDDPTIAARRAFGTC